MIFNKIFSAKRQSRSVRLRLAGKEVTTPLYFPSVSSFGTHHNVDSLTELIIRSSYPYMLVSAYDVFHRYYSKPELIKELKNYHDSSILLLDSGGFECYWNNDIGWNLRSYADIVKDLNCSIFTSFDPTVNIPDKDEDVKARLFSSINDSASISSVGQYMPIFHARKPEGLIESLQEYLRKTPYGSQFIAIPERECGYTLLEKARTILRLREQLDALGNEQILHILGCGHPLSIAVYCYCGADSFDSRDWMRVTVDKNSLNLTDFSHLELQNCSCKACTKNSHPIARVFLHNLEAYMRLMNNITELIKNDHLEAFLKDKIGPNQLDRILS